LVAEEAQKILGIIGLQDNEIRTFYVDPTHQGKGVGKLLYNKIKELSSLNNAEKLIVRSSPEAEPI